MANPTDHEIPRRGRVLTVWYAERANGKRPAEAYLASLQKAHRAKFFSLIRTLADVGVIENDTKMKDLGEGIWELKVSSPGSRLLCFKRDDDWFLTHGCPKLKKKEFQDEIKRAKDIRAEHLERMDNKAKKRKRR